MDKSDTPSGKRALIEKWMPIAALSEECIRERRSMTALPPTYYLHVWWARRPLVACRAAIIGALLPEDADQKTFMRVLGIHGDPVMSRRRIEEARRKGERFSGEAYSYKRAFTYSPDVSESEWIMSGQRNENLPKISDPTAGGGSIPFEAIRMGCETLANDLNPVAWLILKTTVDLPMRFGNNLLKRFKGLSAEFIKRRDERLGYLFPPEPEDNCYPTNFLWARTITCPYCNGTIPLSPNWRLNNKGTGVRLIPMSDDPAHRHICFEIVTQTKAQSPGTVTRGIATCPFPDCGRVVQGDEIKSQAQAGNMGEQLYAIVFKTHQIIGQTKAGKPKIKKIRGFRSPRPEDDVREQVRAALDEKMGEWMARGIVPDEERYIGPSDRSANYGVLTMQDLFSPRQLYGHCISVEVFHELIEECGGLGNISELDKAALSYIALSLDKILNYNSRMSVWMATREVMANTFNRHDFAFCWSHGELAPTITGLGYDWAFEQTGKSLKELIELSGYDDSSQNNTHEKNHTQDRFGFENSKARRNKPEITITCESADMLPHIQDHSVDAVIMDPPYYDNVMYAELSDFFYVWLKRTAGLLYPEQFAAYLTDKDREAVANPVKFKHLASEKGISPAAMAARDYQEKMRSVFQECIRTLKPQGIMVLMFTHKASGAWDALAKGLVEAGFVITASWPINTEAEGSLHIKDKNAAKSTIFLICRPRQTRASETTYWEDVEPRVREVVNERVQAFQESGIRGVDLYLSCFGPALEVFSTHWPMERGRAAQKPEPAKGSNLKLIEDEEWDPYAVRPEDALMSARTAVKQWRLAQLASVKRQAHLDPLTEFFVLAWDAFQSPRFPADEALKLARVVGLSFDQQLRTNILEVTSGHVTLWDSGIRAQKRVIGPLNDGTMIDALHRAAHIVREQNTGIAKETLKAAGFLTDQTFMLALETLLNVLPKTGASAGSGPVRGAAADGEALEKLRQLAFAKEVPPPLRDQDLPFPPD